MNYMDDRGSSKTEGVDSPIVSVIVPVYNDPEGIRTTLNSLTNQLFEGFEVLVVDNNSNDSTSQVIDGCVQEYPEVITHLEETEVQSSYAARNTGIAAANGEILIFIDSDMWVKETWIKQMVSELERRDCAYLGCDVEVIVDDEPSLVERYERTISFPVEEYIIEKRFAPTCSLAVYKRVFDSVGLFDYHLESGGDKEFGHRVYQAGFEQGYAGGVTAFHPARDSWAEVKSKALRIGRGRAQMRRYHPEAGGYFHPLNPVNFLPPSPFRLKRRSSGGEVSTKTLAVFYLLEYVLKLTQAYGMIREALKHQRSGGKHS